jgi:MerR family transcriptional regulator, redox-sensitive transcriptional activator SoxR
MGLRSSAIRYYERLGLIPNAPRVSGRRWYDERVLERLAMVRFAKHVGFSIAEIKVLLRGVDGRPPPERWRKLAAEKVAQVDAFVVQARTSENCCPKRWTSSVRNWWNAVVPCRPQSLHCWEVIQ